MYNTSVGADSLCGRRNCCYEEMEIPGQGLRMMRPSTIAGTFALVALLVGCGGTGGVRQMQAMAPQDAARTQFVCGTGNSLDCTDPSVLKADGHLTNFSYEELAGATRWCDESGVHGTVFAFNGIDANTHTMTIDAADGSVKLNVMVSAGSYAGGGLAFESCLNATEFTGVRFTVAVSGGSLTGCTYQLQLQTFEQRPKSQNPAGACDDKTSSCYNFPSATGLPAPSTDPANPTLVTLPFSAFTGNSVMPPPTELVGLQWQVNSSGGACMVELRIDDVDFIPAVAPGDAGTD